jgi:pimeloyl-ACP methyl ester carboxylesterase
MADWRILERAGVRLAVLDFGGEGPTALLLHGLAGHAEEWTETAAWLTDRCHLLALDARGHGRSERRPADVSRAAHVADAVFALEADGPAILIGQSLGGVTALLVAAERPDLARALVVAEASPAQGSEREVARDGLWPRFDVDVMARTLREADSRSYCRGGTASAAPSSSSAERTARFHPPTHRP